MKRTGTVIIGGGQAGLAMSRHLGERGIEHVVLERGRLAERWRSERWDSLRLLTPNWLARLPGFAYDGPDPDGFMTMPEVVAYFERFAASFGAPVETETTVESLRQVDGGFVVMTNRGAWAAPTAVLATGYCDRAAVPPMASALSPDIVQLTPQTYRNPSQIPDGGVLVVGASASGVQLADEIHGSGRPVTMAVGHHTRLPRRYRGRDILWWMDRMGLFAQRPEDVADLGSSRRQPSLQLVGRPDHSTLGIGELRQRGVRLIGRVLGVESGRVSLDPDLVAPTAAADAKLALLLARVDEFIRQSGIRAETPEEVPPTWTLFANEDAPASLDLAREGIRTVVWATGYTRAYPWLQVPVLDAQGEIRHTGGVTPVPGLVAMGLPFLRRRSSTFIDGVGDDARELSAYLACALAGEAHAA